MCRTGDCEWWILLQKRHPSHVVVEVVEVEGGAAKPVSLALGSVLGQLGAGCLVGQPKSQTCNSFLHDFAHTEVAPA